MEEHRVIPPHQDEPRRAGAHPRVLMIEPDSLLRWSVSRYLERAVEVVGIGSLADAAGLDPSPPFRAVIVSDNLPAEQTRSLVRRLRERCPSLTAIILLSAPAEPWPAEMHMLPLEKPFKLSALAELLEVDGACARKPSRG